MVLLYYNSTSKGLEVREVVEAVIKCQPVLVSKFFIPGENCNNIRFETKY